MNRQRLVLVIGAIVTAALVAGCGIQGIHIHMPSLTVTLLLP